MIWKNARTHRKPCEATNARLAEWTLVNNNFMKTQTVTRIVYNSDDLEIVRSWGEDWKRIKKDLNKHAAACFLEGDWHGPNGVVLVHREFLPREHSAGVVLKTIVFGDNTVMDLRVVAYSIEQILTMIGGVKKKLSYQQVVDAGRRQHVEVYRV